jgi:hypothetical protein
MSIPEENVISTNDNTNDLTIDTSKQNEMVLDNSQLKDLNSPNIV